MYSKNYFIVIAPIKVFSFFFCEGEAKRVGGGPCSQTCFFLMKVFFFWILGHYDRSSWNEGVQKYWRRFMSKLSNLRFFESSHMRKEAPRTCTKYTVHSSDLPQSRWESIWRSSMMLLIRSCLHRLHCEHGRWNVKFWVDVKCLTWHCTGFCFRWKQDFLFQLRRIWWNIFSKTPKRLWLLRSTKLDLM